MIIPGVEFFVRKVWQGMQFEGKQLCTSAAQYRLQTLLQTSKRILDTAFISYKVQGYTLTKLAKHGFPTLHTILGNTSCILTKLAKHGFQTLHTILGKTSCILTKLAKHGFQTLHTILGKTSYTFTKPAFVILHTILAIHLHSSYVILMQHNTVYTG